MDITSLFITGKLALVVTPLLLAASLPVAWLLAFSRIPGKGFVEATCCLPLVLPPTVLGFYLLVFLGPHGALGAAWESLFGGRLVFTFSGLVLASMVYSLPFAILPLKAAFQKLDPRLMEAAAVLGLSSRQAFFRVVLPNSLGGLATAAVLVFAHTMGEFGVALMIGGSIPGQTKVASISIYESVESLEYADAWALSAVLLGLSYVVLFLISRLDRNGQYGGGRR
ncbi:molybdate ABC transporter permease subunit [Salidesulfovibrio onnuriiensis]|uniref:molybdate ABC transporter permease subunit n=1 Tax=Salidesulfovibrio onnuriiensis TaxID=2583823 RepID=UPI0011CC5965|nr:molybdate ABC transporter permease subunit [Salidesulfovibrio onnuriiensis]